MSQQDPRLNHAGAEHHKGEASYVGHILEPVKITQTNSGRQVANARIQICKLGQVDQSTGIAPIRYDNYSVKIWGSAANMLAQAQVGQEVCVMGEIENESWTDQQTQQKRYRTVISGRSVFLGSKSRYPVQSHNFAATGQPAAQHNYGQAPQQSYGQAPQQSYGQPTQHQYTQPSQHQYQTTQQAPQGTYPPPASGGPLQRPVQPSYPVQPQAAPQAPGTSWTPPPPPGLENIPF